jgi:predicted neuraminidase
MNNILRLSATVLTLFFPAITCLGQITLKKVSEELVFKSPPFTQCHASTIVEITPGKYMVAAFGGTAEGNKDVCIWSSISENGKWNEPSKMADGIINDTLRYPCWNPVLFRTREGKLFLWYKTGPSPRIWWGMVRTSTDAGRTWTSPERLPPGILGPIKNKPVQLPDGSILSGSSVETSQSWKVHLEKSVDSGRTWKVIPVDTGTKFYVIQPTILLHPDNKLQILCRSKNNAIVQAFSTDNGITWGTLTRTELPNPNSGIDAVTLKDGWFILAYNPTIQGNEEDRAKLNVAVSKDGIKWKDELILENESKGEFSYPAVIQTSDGKINIIYTYNRANIKHVVLEEKPDL